MLFNGVFALILAAAALFAALGPNEEPALTIKQAIAIHFKVDLQQVLFTNIPTRKTILLKSQET